MCTGHACSLCAAAGLHDLRACDHSEAERHSPVPAADRVPTRPLERPLRSGRIEIDLEDAGGAAEFLELVAKIIRSNKRIVILVE